MVKSFLVFFLLTMLFFISFPKRVYGQALPDLALSAKPLGALQVIRSQNDTVRVVVHNIGAAATSVAFDVTVYLSADSTAQIHEKVGDSAISNALIAGDSLVLNVPVRVPALFPLGAYLWLVQVDASGFVTESDETNNFQVGNAVHVVSPPPDLVVTSAPVGLGEVNLTGSYTVQVDLRNQGIGATPNAFAVAVFLSADSVQNSADIEVGRWLVSDAIASGLSRTLQIPVAIPQNQPLGLFRWLVVLDVGGNVNELNENNNLSVGNTTSVVEKLADLIVLVPPAGPNGVFRNGSYAITTQIKNQGIGFNTSVFDVVVYLSEDLVVGNADDVRVGDVAVSNVLAVDSSLAISVPVTIPALQPYRSYRWIVVVDDAEVVKELDETNNALIGQAVSVVPSPADLTIENPSGPTTVVRSGVYQASLEVANVGAGPTTGAFQLSVFLSADDSVGNGDDVRVGGYTVTGILTGGSRQSLSLLLTVPTEQAFGTFRLFAVADVGGIEAESNELNNARRFDVPIDVVPAPPDLIVVTDPAGPLQLFRGIPDTVLVSVRNQGQGAVLSPFQVFVYVSSDTTTNSGDIKVGQVRITQVIDIGQTLVVRVPVVVDANQTVGVYRWWAHADAGLELVESDETNNLRLGVAVNVVHFPADLTLFDVFAAPDQVARGGVYSVQVPVRNRGDGPAESGFHVAIFLSPDQLLDDGDVLAGGRKFVEALAPGQQQWVVIPVVIPQNLPVGNYRWIAQVLPVGLQEEANVTNNIQLGNAVTFPVLAINPDSLSFGLVRLDEPVVQTFDILNGGTGNLSFQIASSSSQVVVKPESVENLPPGVRWPVTVTFSPETEGDFRGLLTISSKGSTDDVHVVIRGQAVRPQKDRLSLDFNVSQNNQQVVSKVVRMRQTVAVEVYVQQLPQVLSARVLVHYDSLKLAYVPSSWVAGDLMAGASQVFAKQVKPGIIELNVSGDGAVMGGGSGLLGQVQFETLPAIRGHTETERAAHVVVQQLSYVTNAGVADSVQVLANAVVTYHPVAWADFDGNGHVNFSDFLYFRVAFDKRLADVGWAIVLPEYPEPQTPYNRYDGDNSGEVSLSDFVLFTTVFDQKYSP